MAVLSALGGIITTFTSGSINYTSHTFTSSGVFEYTGSASGRVSASVVIVAGGGGGAMGRGGESEDVYIGGHGGDGGQVLNYYSSSFIINSTVSGSRGIWNVIVGNGGKGGSVNSPATSGQNSYFSSGSTSITASAGSNGNESNRNTYPFGNGGASGGSGYFSSGSTLGSSGSITGDRIFTQYNGGDGAPGGFNYSENGSEKYYGSGGGGAGWIHTGPGSRGASGSELFTYRPGFTVDKYTGGKGGEANNGNGGNGEAGFANTGQGGGGGAIANQAGRWGKGGNGGSGVVIVTYVS